MAVLWGLVVIACSGGLLYQLLVLQGVFVLNHSLLNVVSSSCQHAVQVWCRPCVKTYM
jgi:hypothetical protein